MPKSCGVRFNMRTTRPAAWKSVRGSRAGSSGDTDLDALDRALRYIGQSALRALDRRHRIRKAVDANVHPTAHWIERSAILWRSPEAYDRDLRNSVCKRSMTTFAASSFAKAL